MQQRFIATAVAAAAISAAVPAAASLPDDAQGCCAALESAGLPNVLYPGSREYQNRTLDYWSISAQLTPWCIVQPTCPEEVSTAVTTLVQKTQCQFAIRSGGHMTWGGAANIEDGITLDLGLMKTTTYNEENQIASIDAGSRWNDVYVALQPHGVTVPGGRAPGVGVGGFLTGGGNSFYSAKKGFACDNVINFEMVKADGEIINANAKENPDLWRALKGGQSNFGVVTRFDMQAFDAPDLWGGVVTYPKSTGPQHIEAYTHWVDNVENDVNGSALVFWQYDPSLRDIHIISAYHDVAGNVRPAGFSEFLSIQPNTSSSLRTATHKNLVDELVQPAGYRDVWWSGTIKNDKTIYSKIISLHEELCDSLSRALGGGGGGGASPPDAFVTQAMFQAIPTIFSKHGVDKGGNMLGLDRETENVVMLLFTLGVKGGKRNEEIAVEHMKWFSEKTMEFADKREGAVQWQYINYSYDWEDPLASYGVENQDHIRKMAREFDPEGVFQTRAPGGFKVSRSGKAENPYGKEKKKKEKNEEELKEEGKLDL